MSVPNTVVTGSSKTGTTGLYLAVWEGMHQVTGGNCYGLREQDDLRLLQSLQRRAPDRPLAAKFLLTSQNFSAELLEPFDRHLMIVRDPRDTLLSVALFYPVLAINQGVDHTEVERVVELLRKKEEDPRSVDFLEVFQLVHAIMGRDLRPGRVPMRRFRSAITHADSFAPHIVQYERLIRDDLTDVSEYLGFEVHNTAPKGTAALVMRSGSDAEWRDWFTERDVEALRPALRPYMERFGYADDWALPEHPEIEPSKGSDYVLTSVAKRRRHIDLERQDGYSGDRVTHLRDLAGAGSVRASLQLAEMLNQHDPVANAAEVRELLGYAAAGGNPTAMWRLAAALDTPAAKDLQRREARRWRAEAAHAEHEHEIAAQKRDALRKLRVLRAKHRRLVRSRPVRAAEVLRQARNGGPVAWLTLPRHLVRALRGRSDTDT